MGFLIAFSIASISGIGVFIKAFATTSSKRLRSL
jgi:hypothetical protein